MRELVVDALQQRQCDGRPGDDAEVSAGRPTGP